MNKTHIMIQLNEIRIGNYLKNGFNETIQVDGVISENNTSGYQLKTLKPIPITEDELIKLGFVSNPYEDRYEIQNIHVECDKTKGETLLWLYGAPYVKQIHQLQNLYFALTNKELRYNE